MSPYCISLHPRNARGGEIRPVDDVDNKGKSLRECLLELLKGLESATPLRDRQDPSRSIRVNAFREFGEFIYVEFGVSRSGSEGQLHRKKGRVTVPVETEDETETFVRSLLIVQSGRHDAYWLTERHGMTSALPLFTDRIRQFFAQPAYELTTYVEPVATWNALKDWADKVLVQEMNFDAPRFGDDGRLREVNGRHATVRVSIKPKGSLTLRGVLGDDGRPDRKQVFGFLSEGTAGSGKSDPDGLLEQGWKAKVAFETPSGHRRSFGLSLEETAPSMIYGVTTSNAANALQRPSDSDFLEACADFVSDVHDTLGLHKASIETIKNLNL